ncbi:MAG: hypothetical protein ACKO04_11855 [Actinomycetes bacterium]
MAGQRPFGVSLLTIIIVIYGISAIVMGILMLLSVFGDFGTGVLIAAALTLLIGLVYLAVASGLWNGSRVARPIVKIVTVLGLLAGILMMTGGSVAQGAIQVVITLIILFLLFNSKAKAFLE